MYEPFVKTNLLRLPPKDPKYRYADDYLWDIMERAKRVELDKLAMDVTSKAKGLPELKFAEHISDDTYAEMKKLIVAMALVDNLAASERGLVLRYIMPQYDLSDQFGAGIRSADWLVPPNGGLFQSYHQQLVWLTNTSTSRNDRKVYLLFGVGYGPNSSHVVQQVVFKRSDIRTLSIISMSHLAEGQLAPIDPPILMKRNDDLCIHVNLPERDWRGRFDDIVVYGWVVEAMGTTRLPIVFEDEEEANK